MFWAPCSSGGGQGWMDGGGGWLGDAPHTHTHACVCTHVHACTCVRVKHDNFMQMAAPLGESLGIPYDVICTCVCMHVCACTCACMCMCGGHPLTTPHPIPHTPPPGWTPRITQNSIALELIKIFQFRLKI